MINEKINKTMVVIPAYNEELNISKVIMGVKEYGFDVLVIDDGSNDNTVQYSKNAGALVLSKIKNCGVSNAILSGLEAAKKRNFEFVITSDGDGQHNAKDVYKIFNKLIEGYDFVIGQRNFGLNNVPRTKKISNTIAKVILEPLLRPYEFDDVSCGLRGYKVAAQKSWNGNNNASGYGWLYESLVKTIRENLSFSKVLIETIYDNEALSGTSIKEFTDFIDICLVIYTKYGLSIEHLERILRLAKNKENLAIKFLDNYIINRVVGTFNDGYYKFIEINGFEDNKEAQNDFVNISN